MLRIEYKESAVYSNGRFLCFFWGSVEEDSAENLIDDADGVQSLRLDGRKACNIKRVGISQAESNKATVCALPSIHLPLTRDGHGCPKLNAQSFARMRNQQSVNMARI